MVQISIIEPSSINESSTHDRRIISIQKEHDNFLRNMLGILFHHSKERTSLKRSRFFILVAQIYIQHENIDYTKVVSIVAILKVITLLLSCCQS